MMLEIKPGQHWQTMSGGRAVILMINAPDKKCCIIGFIFQDRGCIHPCLWDEHGNYFGSTGDDSLADGKYHLAEPNVEYNKIMGLE